MLQFYIVYPNKVCKLDLLTLSLYKTIKRNIDVLCLPVLVLLNLDR